jgi:hypothetical protein
MSNGTNIRVEIIDVTARMVYKLAASCLGVGEGFSGVTDELWVGLGVGAGVPVGFDVGVGVGVEVTVGVDVGVGVLVGVGTVVQVAVAVLGLIMVIGLLIIAVPDASSLQPVKRYCTPLSPEMVPLLILAVAFDPVSYHPAPLVVP